MTIPLLLLTRESLTCYQLKVVWWETFHVWFANIIVHMQSLMLLTRPVPPLNLPPGILGVYQCLFFHYTQYPQNQQNCIGHHALAWGIQLIWEGVNQVHNVLQGPNITGLSLGPSQAPKPLRSGAANISAWVISHLFHSNHSTIIYPITSKYPSNMVWWMGKCGSHRPGTITCSPGLCKWVYLSASLLSKPGIPPSI